jgi:soluble lytic murein transglycosylase-like protein
MVYSTLITLVAKSFGVPGALMLAVCSNESNLTNAFAPHDGGSPSFGICQIKLDTAKMVGYLGDGHGLMNPEINVKWSAIYLKKLLDQYDDSWCKSVSAYNLGTFKESRRHRGRPINMSYVKKVQEKLPPELRYKLSCDDENSCTKTCPLKPKAAK